MQGHLHNTMNIIGRFSCIVKALCVRARAATVVCTTAGVWMTAWAAAPATATATAPATAATWPGPTMPTFATAADVDAACEKGLRDAKALLAKLELRKPDALWLSALDDLHALTEDHAYPIGFLSNVHPDRAVREAGQACEVRWQEFGSTLGQNAKIYALAKAVRPRDAIDTEMRRQVLEAAEDAGVALPKSKRDKAKALSDRIAALGLDFDRNLRDHSAKVAFKPEDLQGVPRDLVARIKPDATGNLLLGLDGPTFMPVLQYADNGSVRERMWRAKQTEGGEANLKLLDDIVKLRKEYAGLFGFTSYNDFVLRRRMVQSTARATRFLDELRASVEPGERKEITVLREAKALHLKDPSAKLERWDLEYYSERVKRASYNVDQNLFRQYFPPQESVKFVMAIAQRLFGVTYEKADIKGWHPDVQAYAVLDEKTRKPLAGLWVDLYPREGKYNHAAVWPLRSSATRNDRLPQSALVVNMDREGLTLDELETLLHEFGHALHNNLSSTRYALTGGTSTLRDFVEAPSQMLEDWVYDPKVVALFASVCAACKPVPGALIMQADKARTFGKQRHYARQNLYASYDLALHAAAAPDPMRTWAQMESITLLGHVKDTKMPASFSHVASGYAAGYYGYLWSEVVAHDLRTAFAKDKLSREVGMRYRRTVLSQGGQRPPLPIVRDFLGRDTNPKAFNAYVKK
jgi:thimet oligopeptidase